MLILKIWLFTFRYFERNEQILEVEQLKGSGGSFQDALGGLFGGVKFGRVNPSLPLSINIENLGHSGRCFSEALGDSTSTGLSPHEEFKDSLVHTLKEFEDRLVLIYTGKIRLSRYRYLMQVIRV